VAAVLVDDGPDRGQPQPVAGLLGGEIGVEDLGDYLRIDAASLVPYNDLDVAPWPEGGNGRRWEVRILQSDCQVSAVGHGLPGVDDEVGDNLLDLAFVRIDWPLVCVMMINEAHVAAGEVEARDLLDHVPQTHVFLDRRSALGEGQQLFGQPHGAGHGFLRFHERRVTGMLFWEIVHGDRDVAEQPQQDVVEVVRDPARERADALELVQFLQFCFGPLALGDVGVAASVPPQGPVSVQDRIAVGGDPNG